MASESKLRWLGTRILAPSNILLVCLILTKLVPVGSTVEYLNLDTFDHILGEETSSGKLRRRATPRGPCQLDMLLCTLRYLALPLRFHSYAVVRRFRSY
jgi:hypothetical protein